MNKFAKRMVALMMSVLLIGAVLSGCGHTHTWSDTWQTTKVATCTEEGTEIRFCLDNEDHIDSRSTAKIPHAPGSWIVVTPATCTQEGTREKRCAVCGLAAETGTIAISDNAHNWGIWMPYESEGKTASTCHTAGYEERFCLDNPLHRDERYNPNPFHRWDSGIIDPPTCTEIGSILYTCILDNTHTKTEILADLGHDYVWVRNGQEEIGTCQRCDHIETSPIVAPDNFVKLASAGEQSYAIDNNGNLWAWGSNRYGQMGNGTIGITSNHKTATRVNQNGMMDNLKIVDVATGRLHVLALDQNGNVWSWGQSNIGQLGLGIEETISVPTRINTDGRMNNLKAKKVMAGNEFSLIIDQNDELWAFGNNYAGQLGIDSRIKSLVPVKISFPQGVQIKDAFAGHSGVLVIDTDGNLWSWGSNAYGQIGDGEMGSTYADRTKDRLVPYKLDPQLFNNKKIVKASSGLSFTLAIDEDGNLWSWGSNNVNGTGYLGIDSDIEKSPLPNLVNTNGRMNDKKVVEVLAGTYASYAIDVDGNLWGWGSNRYGELGDGTKTNRSKPVMLKVGNKENNVSLMALATFHSIVADKDGQIWASGNNEYYQLGNGTVDEKTRHTGIVINF